MTIEQVLQLLTLLPFVVIFIVVVREAARRPYRTHVQIALFFGALTFAVGIGWVFALLEAEQPRVVQAVTRTLAVALPYFLLRLVAEFAAVPRLLMAAAGAGLAVGVAIVFFFSELPPLATAFIVAYFTALQLYSAVRFVTAARSEPGVTRRRMQAAAVGSVLLGATILVAGVRIAMSDAGLLGELLLRLALMGSGVAYLAGFAPPALLRRAWQQPELQAFLQRVTRLPWIGDTAAVLRGLEAGAASAFGADRASIMLWDPEAGILWAPGDGPDGRGAEARPGQYIAGRAFADGRPIFTLNAAADDPEHADVYREFGARAVMSAPIVAGGERLGVLSVYGPRPPVFAEDDLDLVQLLADQAAVTLEARRLLEEAAHLRAREEATRLRDDFLSAAAHDIKTPLTSIMGFAQILEIKAEADPDEPVNVDLLRRISSEAQRLRDLVERLLDAGRGEVGGLVGKHREEVDLADLAREVCGRYRRPHHPCVVQADGPIPAGVDPIRMAQLIENLVQNGQKYSPEGGEITVRLWSEPDADGGMARISVADRGIGIPAQDLPHVFERFRRAANIDDRRFAGMGLGLYICRMIAEQHGGRIWVESQVGAGSTFHVAVPRNGPVAEEERTG